MRRREDIVMEFLERESERGEERDRGFLAADVFVDLLHAIQSEVRGDFLGILLLIENQFGSSSGSYSGG